MKTALPAALAAAATLTGSDPPPAMIPSRAWHFCLIFHCVFRYDQLFSCHQRRFFRIERKLLSHARVRQPTEIKPPMIDDDLPDAARHATAANVLQCLTMLAEEAVNLNLPRTMLALRKAIRACQAEQARPMPAPRPRRHLVLH